MKRGSVLVTVLVAIFLVLQTAHAQDQVGAPKNLTPQIVKNAVNLVKEGKHYSLARTLEIGIPTHPFHHPLFYVTYRTIPQASACARQVSDSMRESAVRGRFSSTPQAPEGPEGVKDFSRPSPGSRI
jgi:hypothetical protein